MIHTRMERLPVRAPVGFFKIKYKNQHVFLGGRDDNLLYRIYTPDSVRPPAERTETEEAKMQFQPCCGLSPGGDHACTQADNNGGEERAGGSYFAPGWLAALKHFSFRTYLQVLICCLAPSVLHEPIGGMTSSLPLDQI